MTMSVRSSAAVLVATLVLAVCGSLYADPGGQLLPSTAHAQSKPRTSQAQPAQKSPTEQLRSQVETLINRLRGRDMPDGIVKSNGRIEATQVDVSAKYPGRVATLTVDEGEEVNYARDWVAGAWRKLEFEYIRSSRPKGAIYLESLPVFTRGLARLPNNARLIRELRLLERRTHRSGKDTVEHPRNGQDDLAMVVCGVLS